MQLCIKAKHTKQELQWEYLDLHRIRRLAMVTCGYNKSLQDYYNAQQYVEFKIEDLPYTLMASYFYPELMCHCDDSGYYAYRNKTVDTFQHVGNIRKLNKELKKLTEFDFNGKNCNEKDLNCLKEFYEIVSAECKSSKYPKLEFC